ncbi:MAG: 3'(2'),5'-bisphosphate nucleotidase CysQ [Steroidobacteraceae bacterium]|nr:3'(2'),5'-bisphosphate nucleotidase CysQ [Steroidobacteraceae bacterium]MDW8257937.1 3'(2'),5'-bisphosphate nucleotidase CysQ [Gammaproteobacteria bacterium]
MTRVPEAMTPDELLRLAGAAIGAARRAGAAILEVYDRVDVGLRSKDDDSPLTVADLHAQRVLETELAALTPAWPLLSEEAASVPFATRAAWARYWLVDPLDGTKEFLSHNDEFTVNVALIDAHRPVLGVVHVPALRQTYWAVAGHGAWCEDDRAPSTPARRLSVARCSGVPVRVVASRSHRGRTLDAFLKALGEHELLSVGSALKFCLVAEGKADVYPRLGPTSEWDTAAAQAVVEAAGGAVLDLAGVPLRYNCKEDLLNPHFVVIGPNDRPWLDLLRS